MLRAEAEPTGSGCEDPHRLQEGGRGKCALSPTCPAQRLPSGPRPLATEMGSGETPPSGKACCLVWAQGSNSTQQSLDKYVLDQGVEKTMRVLMI